MAKEKSLCDEITLRYKQDIAGLNGANKKYISEIYKERYEQVKEKFANNEIITDEKATNYLNQLVQEILKTNPLLHSSDLRIVFSKAWWPNASSMGEGTILLNIGLFNRLQNESQAIFILCHELSHYYLNHGNNLIQRYVNTIHSKEFQKQLKSIQKSTYRQNQQAESLAKEITFTSRRHGREFEHAADSMAVELMKNTSYDLTEALNTLALLDSVDKDKYNTPLQLASHFNFTSYPFKESWLRSDGLMFSIVTDAKTKAEDDSLKTHPDCKIRIEKLVESVQKFNKPNSKKFIISEEAFTKLKQQFDFEILAYCFEANNVSKCLYYALEMASFFPDNLYLNTLIGKCLNTLYSYQKNHELAKIVDMPGPSQPAEYNTLLKMIQNLRLHDIAALSYYYLLQFQAGSNQDSDFISVLNTSKRNFNN
ncbi:MAG: M48 family metalloprotease [Flavisolibacter sp.]